MVFKTFPVSAQAPINKDASKITSVHAITFVGPGTTKGQPKGLKRLSGESFKENDIIKSPRRSNPLLNSAELFTKTSQQGGTSLLRTERTEHCAGESLLVSNRTAVGFLTARPHSSVGDTLPQVPTGITPNSVASAAADKPQEALCTTKAKGSLIRLSSDGKITKGKISSQSMTCFASGQTMMLHPVLGPQVITMAPKAGSTNVKFIPQGSVGLTNAKTFLVKKDHGET
ncbi:hypothetical protein B566_EDAN017482 [Ephemera danica]|nr:hypothetical protein B566_EDAN017482 [Ephemera danica]